MLDHRNDELFLDPPVGHSEFVGVEHAEQLVAAEPPEDGACGGHRAESTTQLPSCRCVFVESVLGAPSRTDEINELIKLLPASSSSAKSFAQHSVVRVRLRPHPDC